MLTKNLYFLKAFFLYVKVMQTARDNARTYSLRINDATPEVKRSMIGILLHVGEESERKLFAMFDGEFKATAPRSHLLN